MRVMMCSINYLEMTDPTWKIWAQFTVKCDHDLAQAGHKLYNEIHGKTPNLFRSL